MFSKILIANRGEIACRVIRTARRMGIATVAVHSAADAAALHVEMADEAVLVGPAPSAESYLVIDNIMKAIRDTGAEAVHPGYGFLSENATFAKALEKEKVAFIGPGIKAIAAMGDKIESKKLAQEAGVSTVPGHMGILKDGKEAVKIAREVGYPVMIKASAGGGGKGMRVARNDAEAEEGFHSAVSEAKSSFADDRVFVEKYIEEPRHIEIQVLADGHGNIVHLGERECSIQRRHQKVIEEAPSPFLDEATRAAMGAQAVALAKMVDYRSAGTVEFIVDKDRNFFFLEMNTRLQVEHPVTEYVTGLDLVEQMIRVAAGEKLSFGQADVKLEGWAVEARVYAEDPFRNFMPSIGRLSRYRPPEETDDVRVDTGVYEGGEISMYYDPMIAKLIAGGRTRDEAVGRMRGALDAYYIRGVSHNIPFLAALMAHPRFAEGRLSTGFIDEEYPEGFRTEDALHDDPRLMVAVAATLHRVTEERAAAISGQMHGHKRQVGDSWVALMAGEEYPLTAVLNDHGADIAVSGHTYAVRGDWRPGETMFRGEVNARPVCIQIDRDGIAWCLTHAGSQADIKLLTERGAEMHRMMPEKVAPDMSRYLLSPMPGLLVKVSVEAGEEVKAGQELAVVEAMKMENILRAERDGTVAGIHAQAGASLAVDEKILEFETADG
ncbi:MAG: acetyl/propionyl/methylcrotonyl-CoA carboxylase subunit alpha [Proteobacteria bacterium]|nr:acetyl/propionyl/methylcrotonyl-CoA carboxylase subunit alpha [Pseudomonadota bacterium]